MSFLAAPNALSLIPLRIGIATRSEALLDAEIQVLLSDDIRNAVTRGPDLKLQLAAAYRKASAQGRLFIEAKISEADPPLLTMLRASGPR